MMTYGQAARIQFSDPSIRALVFLSFCVTSLILFRLPLNALAHLATLDERYSPNLAIPFISLGLIWVNKNSILAKPRYDLARGLALAMAGLIFFIAGTSLSHLTSEYALAIQIGAVVLAWTGAFVACYGTEAARCAVFPLSFLLLTIPIPAFLLEGVAAALQKGSAETAYRLFKLLGVPVLRLGQFQFSLAGVTIIVAEECSGIRSTLSLLVGSVVAGYLFLRSGWSRLAFALLTIFVGIFKNAVRIVTIAWLGAFVDAGYFTGWLHHHGGLPFSLFALGLLAPMLVALMRTEQRASQTTESLMP